MTVTGKNVGVDMYKRSLSKLGYSFESFELDGKAYSRFIAPTGAVWLTRDEKLSYPMVGAESRAISADKQLSYELCAQEGIRIPATIACSDINQNRNQIAILLATGPVIVKPNSASLSWGLTLNVRTTQAFEEAFAEAQKFSETVLVQEQVTGEEVRFMVVGGEVRAALLRQTPRVVGDGKHTLAELIAIENEERANLDTMATYPLLDDKIIDFSNFDLESIPSVGEMIEFNRSTMIRGGASMFNIVDTIDEGYKAVAEKAARALAAQFVVVDVMIEDISKPCNGKNYAFIEFNSSPVSVLCYSCRAGRQYDVVSDLTPMIDKAIRGTSL
jgi:D-alanine-D-alanine ligase-like ATP-grasp enzyme